MSLYLYIAWILGTRDYKPFILISISASFDLPYSAFSKNIARLDEVAASRKKLMLTYVFRSSGPHIESFPNCARQAPMMTGRSQDWPSNP